MSSEIIILSSARRFSPRSSSRPWSTSNSQGPAIVHIRRKRVTHFSVTPELSIIDRRTASAPLRDIVLARNQASPERATETRMASGVFGCWRFSRNERICGGRRDTIIFNEIGAPRTRDGTLNPSRTKRQYVWAKTGGLCWCCGAQLSRREEADTEVKKRLVFTADRPPPSSSPWRARSREQSACVQILQFRTRVHGASNNFGNGYRN